MIVINRKTIGGFIDLGDFAMGLNIGTVFITLPS